MSLPTRDVIGLMVDNLMKRNTVFPISRKKATQWARDLDIPEGGRTVIYTGYMYQLLPYMIAAVKRMEMMEGFSTSTWFGRLINFIILVMIKMGRFFNRIISVSGLISIPSKKDVKHYGQIIRNIALLLKKAGVEFGYLYKQELYAGALAHDVGADSAFATHARRVYRMLKKNGVRSVITIDPHTTNMLRSVYPKIIEGYDIEVKSYLEVLAASDMKPVSNGNKKVTVHDSCVYARYEGVIEEPRELLRRGGYKVQEPRDAGYLTHCCGGPIESLFPAMAHKIGQKRVQQFRDANGDGVATMCPICMATLQKASEGDLQIQDLSDFLLKAYCNGNQEPGGVVSND